MGAHGYVVCYEFEAFIGTSLADMSTGGMGSAVGRFVGPFRLERGCPFQLMLLLGVRCSSWGMQTPWKCVELAPEIGQLENPMALGAEESGRYATNGVSIWNMGIDMLPRERVS